MICMEAELFAIPRGGRVGLPNGDVLHPDPTIGALFQPRVGLIVEIFGQGLAAEGDASPVVVSMGLLALAAIVAQVMSRGKGIFYSDFEHGLPTPSNAKSAFDGDPGSGRNTANRRIAVNLLF